MSAAYSENDGAGAGRAGSPAATADPTVLRVARQPILDRDAGLIGYELLFREPPSETADVVDHRVRPRP